MLDHEGVQVAKVHGLLFGAWRGHPFAPLHRSTVSLGYFIFGLFSVRPLVFLFISSLWLGLYHRFLLMQWLAICFKKKLQKWFEVFQSSFLISYLKNWSPRKYEDEGPNMHNPNQFMPSQNLFYNFLKWISDVIFSSRFSVFEAHF